MTRPPCTFLHSHTMALFLTGTALRKNPGIAKNLSKTPNHSAAKNLAEFFHIQAGERRNIAHITIRNNNGLQLSE